MLKWLGLRPTARDVRAKQLIEEEWRSSDQPSLFLLVQHHHMAGLADWPASLGVSTYNSLTRAGFTNGWTLPLHAEPPRHRLLDGATISEFVTLNSDTNLRRLVEVEIREVYAWDGHYRSDIYATGFSFRLSLSPDAIGILTKKVRVGEYSWMGDSILCSFAVRVPVRREFSFPEPRATAAPYSEGPYPKPLRRVAKFSADWIEVAALDSKRMHNEQVGGLPFNDLFADMGPVRLS